MTRNETEKLIQRFMDGLTTRDEERRLREQLAAPDTPREWDVYRLMLSPMPEAEELLPQDEADAKYWSVVNRHRPVRRWAVVASIAILLGIVGWMAMERQAAEPQGMEDILAKDGETSQAEEASHKTNKAFIAQNNDKEDSPKGEGAPANIGTTGIKPRAATPKESQANVESEAMYRTECESAEVSADDSPAFADNQDEHPLLAQANPEPQTEQAILAAEYEQTSLSIRKRGERLMSRRMANIETEIYK